MSEETSNSLMEAHEGGAPMHQGHEMGELADNGTNLERERKPATEADQREDDGHGKPETLEDRRLRYEEEDLAQAHTEADNHAELARLLDIAPEDLSIHKSLRGFDVDAIAGYMQKFGLEAEDLADPK